MAKRKSKNNLMTKIRTKQGIGLLAIGVIIVIVLSGGINFSAFGSYDLTLNGVSVGAGGVITYATGAELKLAPTAYGFYGPYISADSVPIPTAMSGTTVTLKCVDNGLSCGIGTVDVGISSQLDKSETPWIRYYYGTAYFIIPLVSAYEGEHTYIITLEGNLEGSTYTFNIIGNEDSPAYPDGGGVLPTEPVVPTFTATPDVTVSFASNETFWLNWTIIDDAPSTCRLYINDTAGQPSNVIEKEYHFNIKFENMTVGVYNVTCVYTDADANVISDTVILTITESKSLGIFDDPMMIMIIVIVVVIIVGGGETARRRD